MTPPAGAGGPCGSPHDKDCAEVLENLFLFLDHEMEDASYAEIKEHLDECSPCLREYGIEQEVKALVARCCGQEKAPQEMLARLRAKLSELVTDVEVSREPR